MSVENYLRTLARFDGDIKRGAIAFDYRTGQCGPTQPTQARSWGAACPSGYCPPGDLPASLGRWFAGDRSACAEKPYTVRIDATTDAAAAVAADVAPNASVTMCPTRIIAFSTSTGWLVDQIRFGNQNQLVGGPVPWQSMGTGVFAAVPIVPDCMYAGMPINIETTLLPDGVGGNDESLWIVFLGPMVG